MQIDNSDDFIISEFKVQIPIGASFIVVMEAAESSLIQDIFLSLTNEEDHEIRLKLDLSNLYPQITDLKVPVYVNAQFICGPHGHPALDFRAALFNANLDNIEFNVWGSFLIALIQFKGISHTYFAGIDLGDDSPDRYVRNYGTLSGSQPATLEKAFKAFERYGE